MNSVGQFGFLIVMFQKHHSVLHTVGNTHISSSESKKLLKAAQFML